MSPNLQAWKSATSLDVPKPPTGGWYGWGVTVPKPLGAPFSAPAAAASPPSPPGDAQQPHEIPLPLVLRHLPLVPADVPDQLHVQDVPGLQQPHGLSQT